MQSERYQGVTIHHDPEGKFIIGTGAHERAYPAPFWVAMLGSFRTVEHARKAIDQDRPAREILARVEHEQNAIRPVPGRFICRNVMTERKA